MDLQLFPQQKIIKKNSKTREIAIIQIRGEIIAKKQAWGRFYWAGARFLLGGRAVLLGGRAVLI